MLIASMVNIMLLGTTNDKAYVDLIKYYLEKMYDIYDKSFL